MSYEFPRSTNSANRTAGATSPAGHLVATIAVVALVLGGIVAFAIASLTLGGDEAGAELAVATQPAAPAFEPVASASEPTDATPEATPETAADETAASETGDVPGDENAADEVDTETDDETTAAAERSGSPAQAPAATTPPAASAPPAETLAPAPAPAPFRPVCSISKRTIEVGETTVFSGTHTPSSAWVSWSFDHGDGYVDHVNPSHALYHAPGTYEVTAWADSDHGVHEVPCGYVTVTAPAEPVEFFCAISDAHLRVGETTVFTGSTDPHDVDVTWTFDHGDGYREIANPSYALYHQPGVYHVVAFAKIDGESTRVECGTVEVIAELPVPECSTEGYVGLLIHAARTLAESRGCDHRTFPSVLDAAAALNGERQPNRVNFIAEQILPFPGQEEAAIVTEVVVG